MQEEPQENKDAPGAIPLRAVNIAPTEGDRLVGYVPYGLTGFRADNMRGKSRLISAISSIPLPTLKPGMVSMVDGQNTAAIAFGTAELRISDRVAAGGKPRRDVDRRDVKAEGEILELPDPIEMMITGGDHKSDDSNWRHRMKALNDFHPVPPTETRLEKLVGPVLPEPHADLFAWLTSQHAATPFESMLAAADALGGPRGELNRRALQTERDAGAKAQEVSRQEGIVGEKLHAAAKAGGLEAFDDATIERALLDDTEAFRTAPDRLRTEELALSRLEVSCEARAKEEARRQELRDAHGEAPTTEEERTAVDNATRILDEARAVLRQKQDDAASAAGALEEFLPQVQGNQRDIADARETWQGAVAALEEALDAGGEDGWPAATAAPAIFAEQDASARLLGAISGADDLKRRHLALLDSRNTALAAAISAEEQVSAAAEALEVRIGWLEDADKALDRWTETDRLLDSPIEGATPEQVQIKAADVEELRQSAALSVASRPYRDARAKLADLRREHQDLLDFATLLRKEALEVWNRLGEIISDALSSDLIRVKAGRIEVRDDDGQWYDVADNERLSKGRLRRAFLDFFLDEHAGGCNVVVPEEILLLIDGTGRREISARAAAKSMRLIFEEPTDEPTLIPVLFWYGNGAQQEVANA